MSSLPKTARKNFIKQVVVLTAGMVVLPSTFVKASFLNLKRKVFKKNQYAIVDMHCHPSMKMFLFNEVFWYPHPFIGKGDNLLSMQENEHQFGFGNVSGIFAAHYLLEVYAKRQWNTLKFLYPLLNLKFHLNHKIEREDGGNFDQVIEMINRLEKQIGKVNSKNRMIKYFIACNYEQYEQALNDPNTIAIVHAIEGAHALGRNFPLSPEGLERKEAKERGNEKIDYYPMISKDSKNSWDPYIANLHKFYDRGVCLITLSHFFHNDLSYPVEGMSPDSKRTTGFSWEYTPDQDKGLTDIGKKVVEEMFSIGMIVDLTHSTPQTREDVFKINNERADKGLFCRPIVFTHTGAQQIFEYYDQGHYPYYKYYDVSDGDIQNIETCNGVIGVIPENFWLVGADTHLKNEFWPKQFEDGIAYMIQTMKYINSRTTNQDFTHVGIGTDFDGLADNPRDLYKYKQLEVLFKAMELDPEIGAKDKNYINQITHLNARRVLKYGWGKCM